MQVQTVRQKLVKTVFSCAEGAQVQLKLSISRSIDKCHMYTRFRSAIRLIPPEPGAGS